MNSFTRTFLSVLMAGVFALPSALPAKAASHDLTIVGGGSGGLWAIITEGVGETVRRSLEGARVTTEPGKDGPNQVMVNRGEVQFGIASDILTLRAVNGEAPFKGKLDKLRLVAVLNPYQTVQFFMDKKTGIADAAELKAKKYPLKITVNRQGTVMDLLSEKLLALYGASYKDITSWGGRIEKIPGPESMDLWDAGQMDAIIEVCQFPSSRFFELGQKHELTLLPLDEAVIEQMNRQMGTTSITIPAGTYPFQKEDVKTVTSQLLLITNADTPDELVEGVLKAMVANLDYLRTVHSNLKDLSPMQMAANTTIPMHPAAEKFYKNLNK
ncbi:TAXI family TRAP transporter solute-binding subunit [uncultured Mailhella sp.]|uniref:TAXI family TRAP transporter solute-binding subunit n=1 Tax=uncultured Mailhella sp. TaxID=1981031 RepID=UPI002638AF9F|nr:TAXI family TRAP transporter solute-binding subunit [uncultured Mailhella sp.]